MSKVESVLENETFFVKDKIYAYLMSQEHSADIDTKLDFMVSQALINMKENNVSTSH